ncbi:hypothetical protein TVAG_347390 [Trichomonas vaginalis G3]|uniref:Uncharacterized protein n=2 Tax=Trichomonas vaginalis (strain ATCC PRA-98 / G3) TaxID=412133 RepID=A2FNQ1_TRIV3|nr:hypothetical protein TVAG_347390 [Trichomonas vaginalis G3]|eukprot:XP_001306382.1 hypothetical protein [Trichomonas vaginalis G3]
MTPLHWAARMQNRDMIKLLLDFGADPNIQDFEGATPLHIAADTVSYDCVETLIIHGANPNIRNEFGTKAIELIKKRGHDKALEKSRF